MLQVPSFPLAVHGLLLVDKFEDPAQKWFDEDTLDEFDLFCFGLFSGLLLIIRFTVFVLLRIGIILTSRSSCSSFSDELLLVRSQIQLYFFQLDLLVVVPSSAATPLT